MFISGGPDRRIKDPYIRRITYPFLIIILVLFFAVPMAYGLLGVAGLLTLIPGYYVYFSSKKKGVSTLRKGLLLIIPLFLILILAPTLVFAHLDYTQSLGCQSTNMTAFWLHNECHHQSPPKAVATTTFHCYNNDCESGDWTPIHQGWVKCMRNQTDCCNSIYDGEPGLC